MGAAGTDTVATLLPSEQVEMIDRTHWRVHRDVAAAVDRLLLNQEAGDELRTFDGAGRIVVVPDAEDDLPSASQPSAER